MRADLIANRSNVWDFRLRAPLLVLLAALLLSPATALAAHGRAVDTVTALVTAGQFDAADARIDKTLKQAGLDADTRRALEFQRARMQRMRADFSLTADQVKAQLRKDIPGLTDAQFENFDAHGFLEHMYIDGKRRYFRRSPSNLFRLSARARALRDGKTRYLPSGLPKQENLAHMRYDRKVIQRAEATGKTSVLPQRVRVTSTITVDADAVPAGKTVRAWIPYPRAIEGQQKDIRFVDSRPSRHRIAPNATLQRTVYLEKTAEAGKPTVFSVTFEVTLFAQYHPIDPDKVVPARITPQLAPYAGERAPHIVFTEPLRVFSRQIVGDTTNPYRIAQKIYAAVDQIPWAGARNYSTIPDLSAYTLRAGHGDCGEQTMLLITLMRMNGIPARWQSGWTFTDGDYSDIHDWAEIYLAPYGWIPVDVTYGQFDTNDPQLKWFYLGGLDNYRIAFNDAWSKSFVPAKKHFRSDTVDSQMGEVEFDGGNLYYDQWSHDYDWKILPSKD